MTQRCPATVFCPRVDHNFLDRLGQDGAFLLQTGRDAQSLLTVIEPKITLGYAPLLEAPLGPLAFLGILNSTATYPTAVSCQGREVPRPTAQVACRATVLKVTCDTGYDHARRHQHADVWYASAWLPGDRPTRLATCGHPTCAAFASCLSRTIARRQKHANRG